MLESRLQPVDSSPGRSGNAAGVELSHQFGDGPQIRLTALVARGRRLAEFEPAGTADIAQPLEDELALVRCQIQSKVFVHDFRRPLRELSKSLIIHSPS